MVNTTTIRWDDETESRLVRWAERTGRTVESLINDTVREKLDEFDDYETARDGLQAFRQADDAAIDLTDVEWSTA